VHSISTKECEPSTKADHIARGARLTPYEKENVENEKSSRCETHWMERRLGIHPGPLLYLPWSLLMRRIDNPTV